MLQDDSARRVAKEGGAKRSWALWMNWPEGPDKNYETLSHDESFESFTAVMFSSRGLWVVTPCSVVVGYRRFRGPCCLHPTTHSTASQPRRPRSVLIVGAVAEIRIAYLPSTNCHNFMRYIHSLSLINKCIIHQIFYSGSDLYWIVMVAGSSPDQASGCPGWGFS